MKEPLPMFSFITTKDGKTGTIVEIYDTEPAYLVDYYPLSQAQDDEQFAANSNDAIEYKKP